MFNLKSTNMKQIIAILEDLFEDENKVYVSEEIKQRYYKLTGMKINKLYQYILEHYSDVFSNDGYGYKAIEKSPFSGDGLDSFSDFIGLTGDRNVFSEYEAYREQLPEGFYPIAHIDGGNLLCMESKTGNIYTWLHDESESNCLFLAQKSLEDFILNIVKDESDHDDNDSGIVSFHFSDELWDAIKNYKE